MSNTDVIVFGICADNNDPWGVGRIRVVIDDKIMPPLRTAINVQEYLAKADATNAAAAQEHAYIPWELGSNGKSPDPYVVEPFLPKHINIIPKIGESVKLIYYAAGDNASQREYIAPQTSNYDKLNFDSIESARSYSKRSTYQPTRNNLRNNGLVADPTDIALTGRKNSEIVLPDDEVIIRAGYQNMSEQLKNNRNAIVQASHYTQRKVVTTEMVTDDTSQVKAINYMVELYTNTYDKTLDPLYIATDILIYKVENIDTRNYNAYKDYYVDSGGAEFQIRVKSDKPDNIISFITDLLKNLDRNNMPLTISRDWVNKPEKNPYLAYWTVDNRSSENTEVVFYPLNLYQVRQSPNNNTSIAEVAAVAKGITSELRPLTKRPSKVLTQTEQDVTKNDPSYDESVLIAGADKVFLLSWFNAQSIQNKIGKYGFPQEEVYLTLQKNTQAMVKGDELLKLLMDVLDLVLNHGHASGVDPIGSLNKDAVTKIAQIKEKYALMNPVTKDLGGGASILNQYLRLD
jgi:hypothetical protein